MADPATCPADAVVAYTMTRCECVGVTFSELAARMSAEGLSLREACHRTGCGQLCTACLPEFERYLQPGS